MLGAAGGATLCVPDGVVPPVPDGVVPSVPDGVVPSVPDGVLLCVPDGVVPSVLGGVVPSVLGGAVLCALGGAGLCALGGAVFCVGLGGAMVSEVSGLCGQPWQFGQGGGCSGVALMGPAFTVSAETLTLAATAMARMTRFIVIPASLSSFDPDDG